MKFSPEYLATYIVRPLRFMFENFAPEDMRWDENPKKSKIEIDTINNFHKQAIEMKPRILVSRGQYQVRPTGLSDNLFEGNSPWASKGHKEISNQFFIDGVAQMMIQARHEGTCEKILNWAQHFLSWSGPMLADTYGFKTTFIPMAVSPCIPGGEDGEVFATTVNLPWTKEEHFTVSSGDQIKLKNFLLSLTSEDSN